MTGKGDLPIKGSCKSCLTPALGRGLSPRLHARPYREPLVNEPVDPEAVVLLDDLGKGVVGLRLARLADGVPPALAILREVREGSRENRKHSGTGGGLASQTEGPVAPSATTQGCHPEGRRGDSLCQASSGARRHPWGRRPTRWWQAFGSRGASTWLGRWQFLLYCAK